MQNLYRQWSKLLDKHDVLLSQLEQSLNQEKQALISNEFEQLKQATLQKEKVSKQVESIKTEINRHKADTVKELGVDVDISLYDLFQNHFSLKEKKILLDKRQKLLRKSKVINRINKFNLKCVKTFLNYLHEVDSILSLAMQKSRTYTADGKTKPNDGGRLISRSL